MSERAPPPPVIRHRPPVWRRPWLVVVLAVAVPIAFAWSALAVFLSLVDWRPFGVDSGTMMPGLARGERILLEQGQQIRRGDVIAFYAPRGGPWARSDEFLQRVVGLPGERIELKSGVPIVNGVAAVQTAKNTSNLYGTRVVLLQERLPDGLTYDILRNEGGDRFDDGGPYVVPAGAYFVMGDNRDDVFDSRGFRPGTPWYVPASDVTGRAKYVYWADFERLSRIGEAVK